MIKTGCSISVLARASEPLGDLMSKLRSFALALAVAVAALSSPAVAQDGAKVPVPSIAIVDVESIMRQSLAVKTAREQLDRIVESIQKDIAAQEQKLRARDQELQQQRSILTPDVYSQRRKELQDEAAGLQQEARSMRQGIDRGFSETMQRIQVVLFEEVGKLAQARNVNLVLPRSQIVVAIDSFDMTEESLAALNKRLPKVELSLERTKAGGN